MNCAQLEEGTVVRLPEHVSYQFGSLLQVGQAVAAEGSGTQNGHGRALEVTTLGAAGETPAAAFTRTHQDVEILLRSIAGAGRPPRGGSGD